MNRQNNINEIPDENKPGLLRRIFRRFRKSAMFFPTVYFVAAFVLAVFLGVICDDLGIDIDHIRSNGFPKAILAFLTVFFIGSGPVVFLQALVLSSASRLARALRANKKDREEKTDTPHR